MRIPERVKAIVFTALVIASAASLIVAAQAFRPSTPVLEHGIAVSLVIEAPGWTIRYESNDTINNTVFAFLLEAAGRLDFVVGYSFWGPPYSAVFIDSINGTRNSPSTGYWEFLVNNVYGSMAADLTAVNDGDRIAWVFG